MHFKDFRGFVHCDFPSRLRCVRIVPGGQVQWKIRESTSCGTFHDNRTSPRITPAGGCCVPKSGKKTPSKSESAQLYVHVSVMHIKQTFTFLTYCICSICTYYTTVVCLLVRSCCLTQRYQSKSLNEISLNPMVRVLHVHVVLISGKYPCKYLRIT